MKKKLLTVLLILTLSFIWGNSLLSRDTSTSESLFILRVVTPFLELFMGQGNVTEHFVRKLAHFCEFAALGAELLLLFDIRCQCLRQPLLLSVSHGLFAALADETIQLFSGRSSQVSDVLLDTAGALSGALLVLIVLFICGRKSLAD